MATAAWRWAAYSRTSQHWLPTGDQLADLLTKRLKAEVWWATVKRAVLNLLLREGTGRASQNMRE